MSCEISCFGSNEPNKWFQCWRQCHEPKKWFHRILLFFTSKMPNSRWRQIVMQSSFGLIEPKKWWLNDPKKRFCRQWQIVMICVFVRPSETSVNLTDIRHVQTRTRSDAFRHVQTGTGGSGWTELDGGAGKPTGLPQTDDATTIMGGYKGRQTEGHVRTWDNCVDKSDFIHLIVSERVWTCLDMSECARVWNVSERVWTCTCLNMSERVRVWMCLNVSECVSF